MIFVVFSEQNTKRQHTLAPECLKKFGEIADSCLRNDGIERPAMSDGVRALEFALQLQETAERNAQIIVPSQTLAPFFAGSLISAANFPHGLYLTPL